MQKCMLTQEIRLGSPDRLILLVRGWGSGDETTITLGALLESLLVIKPLVIKALLPFNHFRNRLPMNHITD